MGGPGVRFRLCRLPGSRVHWCVCDDQPVFGPQNSLKLAVSMSVGYSVEFQLRRRTPGAAPSSVRLDHGDILVMDGLAQSEYEHRTVSGAAGSLGQPYVSLGNAAHCVLSTHKCTGLSSALVCARFGRGFPWRGTGESKWAKFGVMVLLWSVWVCFLRERTWVDDWRRCRSPPWGLRPQGWRKALATGATLSSHQKGVLFASFGEHSGWINYALVFRTWFLGFSYCQVYL